MPLIAAEKMSRSAVDLVPLKTDALVRFRYNCARPFVNVLMRVLPLVSECALKSPELSAIKKGSAIPVSVGRNGVILTELAIAMFAIFPLVQFAEPLVASNR